jgi:hypothetical protein
MSIASSGFLTPITTKQKQKAMPSRKWRDENVAEMAGKL